jgi:hypothetical protein
MAREFGSLKLWVKIVTIVFVCLAAVIVIRLATSKPKSSSNAREVPSISVPELKSSGSASPPIPPPVGVYVSALRAVKGEHLECLQWGVEAVDLKSLELKLTINGRRVSTSAFRAELTSKLKKKLSKKLSSNEWSLIEKCPTEGVLGSCGTQAPRASSKGMSLLPLRFAYDLDVAISMKDDCRNTKEDWSETSAFAEALRNRSITQSSATANRILPH